MAVNNPQQLIDYQPEYMIASVQPGAGNWLGGSHRPVWQRIINFFPPPGGEPKLLLIHEFISSARSVEDLTLIFHAQYLRSNDDLQTNGRERLQRRINYAERWYNEFR